LNKCKYGKGSDCNTKAVSLNRSLAIFYLRLLRKVVTMGTRIDLTGQTINGIYIKSFAYAGGGKAKKAYWNCVCSCGKEFIADSYKLRTGHTKSCGCLRAKVCGDRRRTHGDSGTRLYEIWKGMRIRCHNKNDVSFKNYGTRGIGICDEWDEYEVFKIWALENGYKDDLTIERIDVNGNYCPQNCKWIPLSEQCLNKQDTIWIDYKGERKQLKIWCEELGLDYRKIAQRLKPMGWSVERAFETP